MIKQSVDTLKLYNVITDIYLAVLLFVYLLFPGFGGYATITQHKWWAFYIISAAYIIISVLLRFELVLVGEAKAPSPVRLLKSLKATDIAVLLYLLFTIVSTCLSDYKHVSVWGSGRYEGLLTISCYCICFILVSRFITLKPWMLILFAVAMSINCIICIIQFLGYNPFTLYPAGYNYYDGNIKYSGEFLGTIGNADILSALLSLCIPLFAVFAIKIRDIRLRFVLVISLVLCLAVLFKSFVSGGILAVILTTIISIPVLIQNKRVKRIALIIVISILIIGLLVTYFAGNRIGSFIYEASEIMHGRIDDSFGSGRIYIWRNVIKLIPEHVLFGGGPDTLGLRTDAAFERYDETLGITIHSSVDAAHNEYLNILVNQGALALISYVIVLIIVFVLWIRHSDNTIIAACGCAMLGYCIQAFFGLSSPITTPFLWIALAIINSFYHKEISK